MRSFVSLRIRAVRAGAMGYVLIAPAFVVFAVFFIYPVVYAVRLSFRDWSGLTPIATAPWTGLDNYRELLDDDIFRKALRNTVVFTVTTTVLQTTLAFLLAFGLWYFRTRWSALQRMVIFFPTVLSMVLVGLVWQQFLAPGGPINGLLRSSVAWLGDPDLALWTIAWIASWQWTGWSMMLYLAAMVGFDRELLQAAQIDGASDARIAFSVVEPVVRPVTSLVILLNLIGGVQAFDTIWVTTRGGPNHATETLTTYAQYTAFDAQGPSEFGYASAIATVTIIGLMVLAAFRLRHERSVTA